MDDHALAVDVADLQVSDFSATSAGGIQRHQQDAVEGPLRRIDQTCDLLLAEHLRQVQDLLRIRRLGNAPASLQNLHIEETQRSQLLRHRVRSQLPLAEHGCLILANVFRTKLIRRTMEVPGVVLDRANVSSTGGLGVVATLQFLQHDLP
jgi:hypothetical protein